MFKKKNQPDTPRARQRATPSDTPRSSAVFSSYHANRSIDMESRNRLTQLEQERPKQSRLPQFVRDIQRRHVLSVLVIVIVFLLTIGLDSTPRVVVLGDTAHRFALQDLSVYQQYAHQTLGKSLANNNKLTIDATAVAQKIETQFPEIHAASISLPFIGRKPTLYIQPATPQLILATQSGQFILDANGRALAAGDDTVVPDTAVVPTVVDKSGLRLAKGQIALPSSSVVFITEVAGQLAAKQIQVENWTLPAGGSQLDVKVKGSPYYVKFNLQGDGREQAGTLLALQHDLANKKITPGQYIDVRVPGRAYYK
jgi:hypothetical protein